MAVVADSDSRDAELAALRKRFAGLSAAVDADPREIEIAWLKEQTQAMAEAITHANDPPKPCTWVSLPGGQCVPGELLPGGYPALHAAGFRWDGDKAVFPDDWPKVEPRRP